MVKCAKSATSVKFCKEGFYVGKLVCRRAISNLMHIVDSTTLDTHDYSFFFFFNLISDKVKVLYK